MENQTIINAIKFLERTPLEGREVKAFVEVLNLLNKLLKEPEKKDEI